MPFSFSTRRSNFRAWSDNPPLPPHTTVLSAETPPCMCTARQALRLLLERAESGHPGAPKDCVVFVHPDVSASLGGTGGSMHELLGYHLPWRGYMTAPCFSTWLPPS